MIYFIVGMMIGSLYAIIMGPTTLENTKPAMTIDTFHPVFFLIGIVIILLWKESRQFQKNKRYNREG